MANDEDVARLRQGVNAWNDWRAQNLVARVNLSKANLSKAPLFGANLRQADLRGANLQQANLRGGARRQAQRRRGLSAAAPQAEMKTASFFTYTGPGRISIARWAPQQHPAGYRVYRPLNPRREWMKLSREEFDPIYRGMLMALDPHAVWRELHFLANGVEPVLLCWEPPGKPCHRRHVAAWFRQTIGHPVEEHVPTR